MAKKAPGKAHREGLTIVELMDMFPAEGAATEWFESAVWPDGERYCGKCGSTRTREVPNAKPMPYWCTDCRSYFSVRTGTPIARSNVPLRKWAIAIYLCLTNLKSVSSMKLQRDIGVSQPTAWFMLHRIREAWAVDDDDDFDGPVEVDETYFGGERRNVEGEAQGDEQEPWPGRKDGGGRREGSRQQRGPGRGGPAHGPTRSKASSESMSSPDRPSTRTMQRHTEGCPNSMRRSITLLANTSAAWRIPTALSPSGRCSSGAHDGTFHKMSPKHLQRYVSEFAGKHNIRDSGTLAQMRDTVAGLVGRNLLYRDLIADGLSSGARSCEVAPAPASQGLRPPDRGPGQASGGAHCASLRGSSKTSREEHTVPHELFASAN